MAGSNAVTRIGISTLLVGATCRRRCYPVLVTAGYLLARRDARRVAAAQWLLRPIHVLRSGLRRLERGEPAAALDLPQDEFGEIGRRCAR